MSEYLNHTCVICGKKYHGCDTCDDTKTYMPWRTIVDTIEHYKIFIIIRDYTNGYINKVEAKNQLSKLDLSKLDTFVSEIKVKIDEIMLEEPIINTTVKPNRVSRKSK